MPYALALAPIEAERTAQQKVCAMESFCAGLAADSGLRRCGQ